jgi:SNF2 family DNA or RNA helicase
VLKRALFRPDEGKLAVESAARVWAFDARPEAFKLAAEATRIRLAHLFDSMMAVHTSDVDPLPHQIAAVYETMLPKQPLRFVLADDPGAGKTIMAGLLIRELMLRGDLERCLIVAPGSLVEQWQTELSEKFGLHFDLLTNALVESTSTGNPFVATDAAGEGVNLQVANLMVNYDLPWNPNRIEQRFGRIHRMGQTTASVRARP